MEFVVRQNAPSTPRRACRDPFIVGADRCDENMDGWSIVADFLLGLHRGIFAAKITLDDCVSRRNIEISIRYTRCRDIENTLECVSGIDFSDCDESIDPSGGRVLRYICNFLPIDSRSRIQFFFFFLSFMDSFGFYNFVVKFEEIKVQTRIMIKWF